MSPKVTIGVVLFGTKFLIESLPSLVAQDYKNVNFIFLDQQEGDWEASEFIEKNLPSVFHNSRVKIERGDNRWHSGGQNVLIQRALEMGADYYICASNDMLYSSDFVTKIVTKLEKPEYQKYGSAAVKLRQWNFEKNKKTSILDSCGINISRAHHFSCRGQGELDYGQFDSEKDVFGADGALGIFRCQVLQDVAVDGEFFDELLHYKNDVDLAYRLQWCGYRCIYLPEVVAYHDRQLSGEKSFKSTFYRRRSIPYWARANSFFGHLVVLRKNLSSQFSWRIKMATRCYNLKKLFFLLIFEPKLLKQYWRMRKHRAELSRKSAIACRKVFVTEIERFMK